MSKHYDYDYIIIGSGPAGRTAAVKLAKSRKKVALIEAEELGGAEVNTSDLPYKLALDLAHTYHNFVISPGVTAQSHLFNLPTFTAHSDQLIKNARNHIVKELTELGITIINGYANFIDSHTIAVEDKKITAEYFILATGSKLKTSEINGVDSVAYLTPSSALHIHRLPKFVFVVGGGPTGVEIAEFFASLGSGVIIMELGDHLLPREDEDVAKALTDHFTSHLAITVVTNAKVIQLTEDQTSKIVVFTTGSGEKMVRVDSIVLATGSTPILDYGLENADVDYKRSGIIVDKYFGTSTKNIFAIGDCLGSPDSSTERARLEANILVENLIHRGKTTAKYSSLIRKIDTCPGIATIGLNERDATSRDLKYHKKITPLTDYPNAFLKTLTDHSGRTIGTTLVAPDAGSTLKTHRLLTK